MRALMDRNIKARVLPSPVMSLIGERYEFSEQYSDIYIHVYIKYRDA